MITVGLRLLQLAPVLLFVLLSACATPVSPEQIASADYGKLPSNYQHAIIGYMQVILFDPYSAHYRVFGDPVKGYAYVSGTREPPVFGYLVTVGINAKNGRGAYVGEKPYIFLFHNDQLWTLDEYHEGIVVR
jgi:hypothetical protein